MIGLLALGLGAAAVNAGRSAVYAHRAKKDLRELEAHPISPYSVSSELQQYYSTADSESRNPMGVSPAERHAFQQNLAKQTNTQFNNAVSMSGGNLARSLRGALNSSTLNQVNNFAQFDAGVRRSNRQSALGRLGMATNQFQRIKNMNEQANLQAQAQAGQAVQIQRENIGRAIGSVGNLALMGYGYGMGGGQLPGSGTFSNWLQKRRFAKNSTGATGGAGAGASAGAVGMQQNYQSDWSSPGVNFNTPANYQWNWNQ